MMKRALATGAVIAAALSGCGTSDDGARSEGAAPSPSVVTITATPTPSASASLAVTASPTAVPPNVGDAALQIGEWRKGAGVRTKVIEVRQAERTTRPDYLLDQPDSSGAVLRVRSCVRKSATEPTSLSAFNWSGSDRGAYYETANSSWETWPPLPQYPVERTFRPGTCVEGWVLLAVPDGVHIDTVGLDGGDGSSVAEWLVK